MVRAATTPLFKVFEPLFAHYYTILATGPSFMLRFRTADTCEIKRSSCATCCVGADAYPTLSLRLLMAVGTGVLSVFLVFEFVSSDVFGNPLPPGARTSRLWLWRAPCLTSLFCGVLSSSIDRV